MATKIWAVRTSPGGRRSRPPWRRRNRRTACRRRHGSGAWSGRAGRANPGRDRRTGCSRNRRDERRGIPPTRATGSRRAASTRDAAAASREAAGDRAKAPAAARIEAVPALRPKAPRAAARPGLRGAPGGDNRRPPCGRCSNRRQSAASTIRRHAAVERRVFYAWAISPGASSLLSKRREGSPCQDHPTNAITTATRLAVLPRNRWPD